MRPITRKQREALFALFQRQPHECKCDKCGHIHERTQLKPPMRNYFTNETYREFRKRFRLHGMGSDRYIGGQWCNMFVGIETDGYTHT